jgi:hypothetical protein
VLDLAFLALPLLFVVLVGAGVSAGLAPRLPADAQAALAPIAGAALVAVASVLLPHGVPARPLAVAVAAAGLLATAVLGRRLLRASAVPLAVGLAAVALAAAPWLARGGWQATSLYGSTDAYHWVSQARSYLDGPAPAPVSEHPDRLTYERTKEQHWAVAVPFALAQLAWMSGFDPVDVYGALAALLGALLPLGAYACARGCLGWRRGPAAAAALLLAANASLLFATHFSWQQQAAGAAFTFAAAWTLRLGLEPDAPRRELVLAALLAAAALASYRLGFAPYLGGSLALVAAAYVLVARERLAVAGRLALFAVAAAILAAPSLAALGRGLPEFVSSGGFSTAFKRAFPGGQPAEALGLVPRVWALEEGWVDALELAWLAGASAVALALLALGFRAARRQPRRDFVLAGGLLALGGWIVLLLPPFAPYLSYKLLAYTAPFLLLAALSAGRLAALAVAVLALPAAAVATLAAVDARTATPVPAAPPGAVVEIAVDDPWEQAWALYRLREHVVSVDRPSFLLTAQGRARRAEAYRNGPVSYRLVARGDVLRIVPAR